MGGGLGSTLMSWIAGVDYLNPILGGCFGPGCHVSFGYDLVGDAYNGNNSPAPDSDPCASSFPSVQRSRTLTAFS